MLTHSCGYCDTSGYAQKDGDGYKKRIASFTTNYMETTPKGTPAPPPEGNPKETDPQPKPPKRASSVFDLGNL